MTDTTYASLTFSCWQDVLAGVPDIHEWVWLDLTGVQRSQSLPSEQPRATHLWGWRPQTWVRLRIVGNGTVVGCRLDGPDVQRISSDTWPAGETRVSMNGAAGQVLRGVALTLIRASNGPDVTFIELTESSSPVATAPPSVVYQS